MLLCRELLREPAWLVFDEPYEGLDSATRLVLAQELDRLVSASLTRRIRHACLDHHRSLRARAARHDPRPSHRRSQGRVRRARAPSSRRAAFRVSFAGWAAKKPSRSVKRWPKHLEERAAARAPEVAAQRDQRRARGHARRHRVLRRAASARSAEPRDRPRRAHARARPERLRQDHAAQPDQRRQSASLCQRRHHLRHEARLGRIGLGRQEKARTSLVRPARRVRLPLPART